MIKQLQEFAKSSGLTEQFIASSIMNEATGRFKNVIDGKIEHYMK